MHDRVCPARRMRFSFESRCRLVSLIVEGMSPAAAASRLRCQPRHRLPALAAISGGRLERACRSKLDSVPAAAPARRRGGGRRSSHWRAEARRRPGSDRNDRRAARLDRGQGAATSRLLATRATAAVQGVQHVFHPPVTLAAWPSEDRRSRLVFITRGIDKPAVSAVFAAVGMLQR